MSIFDRRRAPDPDLEPEPEQPKYQQPEARPQAQPQARPQAQPQAQPQPQPQPQPVAAAPAPAPRAAAPHASSSQAYGIQKAIELMRSLPSDNIPLIVQVVRTTLESTNVDIASIIDDAKGKRARITSRIESLRREISNFEEEIAARREEIVALDADHAETKLVQDRLELSIRPRDEARPATPVTVSLGGGSEASRPAGAPPRPAVAEGPHKPSAGVRPPATG